MSKVLYFLNEKTGNKFRILGFDEEAGTVRLKGEHAEFTEKYDKETFKSLGYKLVKQEEYDA